MKNKKNDLKNVCLQQVEKNFDKLEEIPHRKSGSAALDMAYVASGRYDRYFSVKLKSMRIYSSWINYN